MVSLVWLIFVLTNILKLATRVYPVKGAKGDAENTLPPLSYGPQNPI